jgi:hypothetical protein
MTRSYDDHETDAYAELLEESYKRWTGRPLSDHGGIGESLYRLPCAVISHGMQTDPIFCYANLYAQRLFGYSWDEFTSLPSRMSAQQIAQGDRQRLLSRSKHDGYVENYIGVRITKSGKRFFIMETTFWQVVDDSGKLHGQAAAINKWWPIPD